MDDDARWLWAVFAAALVASQASLAEFNEPAVVAALAMLLL